MRIFKSLLAGVGATCLAVVLLYLVGSAAVLLLAKRLNREEGGIGWDPVSALTPLGCVFYLLLAFAAGFWFTYKR